jgi:hypothetical protein
MAREWFDGLYADGAATGRLMVLHLHPWIMGQPWRIRHLDEVLGHICAQPQVWKATGCEIIDRFNAQPTTANGNPPLDGCIAGEGSDPRIAVQGKTGNGAAPTPAFSSPASRRSPGP